MSRRSGAGLYHGDFPPGRKTRPSGWKNVRFLGLTTRETVMENSDKFKAIEFVDTQVCQMQGHQSSQNYLDRHHGL